MNNIIINTMLKKYDVKGPIEQVNALKEIIQEIVLVGLSKAGFFNEAAFYGGTALRVFHNLGRYSEDLDFALLKPNKDFDLSKYFNAICEAVNIYGFDVKVEPKNKANESNIESAFLRSDTKMNIIKFFPKETLKEDGFYKDIKIKFEVDINPPLGANYEYQYKSMPEQYQVKLYDKSSLFAGKLHAVLCRNWKTRTKGRDLYDFIYYVQTNTKINMELLKNKLVASEVIKDSDELTLDIVKKMLVEKLNSIDYEEAKSDVIRFIKNNRELDLWNKEMFISLVNEIKE